MPGFGWLQNHYRRFARAARLIWGAAGRTGLPLVRAVASSSGESDNMEVAA